MYFLVLIVIFLLLWFLGGYFIIGGILFLPFFVCIYICEKLNVPEPWSSIICMFGFLLPALYIFIPLIKNRLAYSNSVKTFRENTTKNIGSNEKEKLIQEYNAKITELEVNIQRIFAKDKKANVNKERMQIQLYKKYVQILEEPVKGVT